MQVSEGGVQIQSFSRQYASSCRYALFDRHGGVSKEPYSSLNGSYSVGDAVPSVSTNREIIKRFLNLRYLVSARQVHGDKIYCLDSVPSSDCEVEDVDAIVTDLPDIGIMVQHADCQAVLLFDPHRKVIGAVHNGWRGSVVGILGKTVRLISSSYGSRPADIMAVISPSLGPCCSEFINHAEELPDNFQSFQAKENYFDFWQISRQQLIAAGLNPASISISGVCTSCTPEYFSYRRAKRRGLGVTGRNCSVVALTDGKK